MIEKGIGIQYNNQNNMVGHNREEKSRHASAMPSSMVPATKRKVPNQVENSSGSRQNEPTSVHTAAVISKDMVYYCFDTLICHLNQQNLPKSKHPKFTNDA